MFENLLYLPLDIENPPLSCLNKLNDTEYDSLVRDDYRNCYHFPMMSAIGANYEWEWTKIGKEFPELVEWFEDVIFPWTGRGIVMIITTPPEETNPPHMDCPPEMFGTLQHKIRYVLQGKVDDLVFVSKEGDVHLEETVDKPFVMSGKWPHYMHNSTDQTKFTLGFGTPWEGDLQDQKYVEILNNSYAKYKTAYKSFDNHNLPEDYEKYYQDTHVLENFKRELINKIK